MNHIMITIENILSCFIIVLHISSHGHGERTKDKMYEEINGTTGCYRRLNATHQIGCSSKRGGSTGVIHYCETREDLDAIFANGTAAPYVPILPTRLFTVDLLQTLVASNKVSGLVLHPNNETLNHFTHDYQCPNPQTSLSGTCQKSSVWNPFGTGLLFTDIPFPVFYVESDSEVMKMKNCFTKFNNFSYDSQDDRSLCALELKSFMFATTNTPTCIRRSNIVSNLNPVKFCDPLGDSNIWASLYPLAEGPKRNETKPIRGFKYIVIAARMDTTSMFDKTSGANSPVTGIVTLLSVAKFLKEILKKEDVHQAKTNILFILFNGETYDYIGSQRMLYDMLMGNFPVKDLGENNDILPIIHPEDINLFIELSQLGNSKDKLYIHYMDNVAEITNFSKKLQHNSQSYPEFQTTPSSLPPASLHTFLKNISTFPGLVISDHETSYTNHFYNSIYDNASNVGYKYYNVLGENSSSNDPIPNDSLQQFVANISKAVALSIYEELTGIKYDGSLGVDTVLVDELFHCYLEDPNCIVYRSTQKDLKMPSTPVSLYVGVDHVESFAPSLTALTLGWFTGDLEGKGDINCTNRPRNYAFKYYNMSKSIYEPNVTMCYKITMNTTDAISPAFIIPDYDWSSGEFSSWTESRWAKMNVRMFLKPSAAHENMTLAIGLISLIFSFITVYFVKSRSHILFTPQISTEAPTDC